jgi:hypothetical protein
MLNQLLWWYGYVVDINDPLQMGRVRVKVRNVYDSIPDDKLPWAPVMGSSINYQGVGDFTPVEVMTEVIGFFADGDSKKRPVVMASMHNIPELDEARHSVSALARGTQILDKQPLSNSPEPPSPYAAEYPYNRTITTRAGHAIELDDTPENERVHIYHKSGTYIEINSEGRIVIKSKDSSFEVVEKDKHLQVNGNLNVRVKGDMNALVEGKTAFTSKGDIDFITGGRMLLKAVGGVKVETSADMTIKANGGVSITKGSLSTLGAIQSATGISGSFTTPTGKQVQVTKGIVTNITRA